MTERLNTLVCTFDPASPWITAYDIRGWIYDTLWLLDSDVLMIQIDGIRRQVYIKMTNIEKVQAVLHETGGQIEYKYPTGQVSTVTLAMVGLGTKRIRVANLPPETSQEELWASLIPYRKIINIETERWSKHCRYTVENGVRRVTIMMNRQVPSHLTAGCRVLLSYEGQPATCCGCEEVGHVYQGCPAHQKSSQARIALTQQTYTNVVSAPTARKEYHPTTVTVDEEQQATHASRRNITHNDWRATGHRYN